MVIFFFILKFLLAIPCIQLEWVSCRESFFFFFPNARFSEFKENRNRFPTVFSPPQWTILWKSFLQTDAQVSILSIRVSPIMFVNDEFSLPRGQLYISLVLRRFFVLSSSTNSSPPPLLTDRNKDIVVLRVECCSPYQDRAVSECLSFMSHQC